MGCRRNRRDKLLRERVSLALVIPSVSSRESSCFLDLVFSQPRHLIQLRSMASVALAMAWHLAYGNMAIKLVILKEFGDSIGPLSKCYDLVTFFLACKKFF